MSEDIGKQVDHRNPGDDEPHPDQSGKIRDLTIEEHRHHGDQDHSGAGPHGVGYPDRKLLKNDGKTVRIHTLQ